MLLPISFNVFVRSNGARPFIGTEIAGFSENLAFSSVFGLSGLLVQDTDELHITIGQRTVQDTADALDFKQITSGVLGVYRTVPESGQDYLVTEVELDPDTLKKSKSQIMYWDVVVRTDVDFSELMLGCTLNTTTTSYSTWNSVECEERTKKVMYYMERYRTPLDTLPEHEPVVKTFTDTATDDFVSLDFTLADDPIKTGSGTLTYSGGGSRYLINFDGTSELQTTDEAPWEMPAHLFIETGSTNKLTDPEQTTGKHSIISTGSMVTVKTQNQWEDYVGWNRLCFAVSSPSQLDSVWEWESEQVTSTISQMTGSLFLEFTNPVSRKLPLAFGIRYRNPTTKAIVKETVYDIGIKQFKEPALVSMNETTVDSTSYKTSLFMRVTKLCPGDRFELCVAGPQLETSAVASSRISHQATREPDTVTYTPTSSVYDDLYGQVKCVVYPAYSGAPTLQGDQYLFDTRDVNGESGTYLYHRRDGFVVGGIVDDSGQVFEIVSASPVTLVYGEKTVFDFWFDTRDMILKRNSVVVGTQLFQTQFTVPDIPRIRIGHDYSLSRYWNGEYEAFNLSSTPIVSD